ERRVGGIAAVARADDSKPQEVNDGREYVCKGTPEKPVVWNVHNAKVTVNEWCTVYAFKDSRISAESGDSKVWAKDGSHVFALSKSDVTAENGATVAAMRDSHVNAKRGSQVVVVDGADVAVDNGATVENCSPPNSKTTKIRGSSPDAKFTIEPCDSNKK